MDIYSIMIRDRRITDYVIEQAYLWLYDQINAGTYVAGDRKSERLLIEIKRTGAVTKESYEEFLKLFLNDPYQYLMVCGRGKKYAGITSDKLENYFLKFNDSIIPVGFVKAFFEDDYETREEIQGFYNAYLDFNINQFGLNCQSICLSRSETLDNIKSAFPGIFKTKFLFHFTNALKLIFMIYGWFLCLSFFGNIEIFTLLDQLFTRGESPVFQAFLPAILANTLLFAVLLFKLVPAVRYVAFYVHWIWVRVRILLCKWSFSAFDAETVEKFKAYFESVNERLKEEGYCLTPEMCKEAPARRRHYLTIMNFDEETITKSLTKMVMNKNYKKFNFYYSDESNLLSCKKTWKKGLIKTVLVLIVFSFLDIPELNLWFMAFAESIERNGFFAAIGDMFEG